MDHARLFRIFARWAGDGLVSRALQTAEEPSLTPAQLRCLDFLARREPCSIGTLAQGLAVSDPAATKLAHRLQDKGLVTRRTCADDRRVTHLQLTRSGLVLIERLSQQQLNLVQSALAALSAYQVAALTRALEAVLLAALDSPQIIERVCLRCGSGHAPDCIVNRAHIMVTGVEIPW